MAKKRLSSGIVAFILALLVFVTSLLAQDNLPVVIPELPQRQAEIRNQLTFEQIHNIIGPDNAGKGLIIDLGDSSLMGEIYTGPYPFDAGAADYDYARYRKHSALKDGQGLLRISDFFKDKYNANDWPLGLFPFSTKSIGYRLDLWRLDTKGLPEHLGFYDSVVAFRKEGNTFVKNLTIVEGPFVAKVNSDNPNSATIVWETDQACQGTVYVAPVSDPSVIQVINESGYSKRHEIEISGLNSNA